eukprot:CFRG2719T1
MLHKQIQLSTLSEGVLALDNVSFGLSRSENDAKCAELSKEIMSGAIVSCYPSRSRVSQGDENRVSKRSGYDQSVTKESTNPTKPCLKVPAPDRSAECCSPLSHTVLPEYISETKTTLSPESTTLLPTAHPTEFRVTVSGELYSYLGIANTAGSASQPFPAGAHPNHHQGVWCHLSEFGILTGDSSRRYAILLGKQRWVCPSYVQDPSIVRPGVNAKEGLHDEVVRTHSEMNEHLVKYLDPTDFPPMLVEYSLGGSEHSVVDTYNNNRICRDTTKGRIPKLLEINRMFVVADCWPYPWPTCKRSARDKP